MKSEQGRLIKRPYKKRPYKSHQSRVTIKEEVFALGHEEEQHDKEKKTEEEKKILIKVDGEIKKPPVKLDLIGFGSFDVPL